MSTNFNPTPDWMSLLSNEVKKLDNYIQIDPDPYWIAFQNNISGKDDPPGD